MRARPFIEEESYEIRQARCFGAAVQFFCDAVQPKKPTGHEDAACEILHLFLVLSDSRGRREILQKQLARPGGLVGMGALAIPKRAAAGVGADDKNQSAILKAAAQDYGYDRWIKAHRMAYAASRDHFKGRGAGEQLYGAPGPNSCMALVDDVTTLEPLIAGAAGLSMETSTRNFQHLYAFDRVITGEERTKIQRALVRHAQGLGLGGDAGAIGPEQPHRVPGSINYKPGRNLFVCRLAATWTRYADDARPLRADEWIRRGEKLAADTPASSPAPAASGLRRDRPGTSGDKTASGSDWAWACAQVEQAIGRESGDDLARRLERELADRVRQRRGKDAERYARLTIFNVRREKEF